MSELIRQPAAVLRAAMAGTAPVLDGASRRGSAAIAKARLQNILVFDRAGHAAQGSPGAPARPRHSIFGWTPQHRRGTVARSGG